MVAVLGVMIVQIEGDRVLFNSMKNNFELIFLVEWTKYSLRTVTNTEFYNIDGLFHAILSIYNKLVLWKVEMNTLYILVYVLSIINK